MDHDSDEEIFNFQNEEYIKEEEFTAASSISNDQHFRILKEISENFFLRLSENKDCDMYLNWNAYSEMEPIEINLEIKENITGVFDMIKSDNIFINKIVSVFSTLAAEIQNILGDSDLACLTPLVVYGENFEDTIEDGEAENQIARMLSYFSDLFEKVTKLLSLAINLMNQMIALYNKNLKAYNDSFKNIGLFKPFEYLGRILGFFLAIDTIVTENENLSNHWRLYRMMFHRCKADPIKFGFSEDQARRLDKIVKRIDGSVLSGKLLSSCVKHLFDNTGDLTQNGNLSSPVNNKEFCLHFTNYFKIKIEKLSYEIGSITETNEKIQLFQILATFAYYCKLFDKNTDKNLFKSVWGIQKKVTDITIILHVTFSIEKFLLAIRPWGDKNSSVSLDPKNVQNTRLENLQKFVSTFKNFASNMRLQTFTWITRMNSSLFESKINENVGRNINLRVKMIINGLILAHQIKNNLTFCLNTHLHENIELKGEFIAPICTCLELLKVIEHQFKRSKSIIALSMNMIIRIISYQIKSILDLTEKKYFSNSNNLDSYKSDVHGAIKILQNNLQASPSCLRLIISEIAMDIIKNKKFFDVSQMDDIIFNYWKFDILQRFSFEVDQVCDCSFFYWFKDIIPECLNFIYSNSLDFKRIYFFALAISETDSPLVHVKYLENNLVLMKKYKESVFEYFYENIALKLAREIENDLRMQLHSILIANLQLPNPCKGEIKDLKKYIFAKPLILFENLINLKFYVEDYLNRTFYDMTTLNLNDWRTYQQMRVLAKTKYNLDLHDVHLPIQTLEQGIDILYIVRNIVNFVQQYNFNLHSQVFVEVTKDNNYVTVIGVQQILNSLYTHGTGIVNTIVNKTYQFLAQRLKTITQFIMDEYIKSSLMLEKRYWLDNKEKINNKFPYERAENLCNDIKNLLKTKDELTFMDKLRNFISQIGNALGFIRVIRTALLEYNAQNLKFFANNSNLDEVQKLIKNIDINMTVNASNSEDPSKNPDNPFIKSALNSLVDMKQIFSDGLNLLDQNKQNNVNFLTLLVNSFDNVFTNQNIPDIDLFFYVVPAVTINFVENSIIAKDKIFKKNIKDAFFTDDGFIMGITYLLKVFKQENNFESLHWFHSVIEKLENDEKQFNSSKAGVNKKYNDDIMQQNMSLRKINTYKNEFELLHYTYNSAVIVFNDY
jgi:WASH complex subunit 7